MDTESKSNRRFAYNPHLLDDNELEKMFVARREIFKALIKDIKGTSPTSPPPHHLIIGQRGMGKSTLLRRVGLELRQAPLNRDFIPLNFPEEQHVEVDRISKFWLNCLDSLADTLEVEGESTAIDRIDEHVRALQEGNETDDELAQETLEVFKNEIEMLGRRPVLLIDNFHLLLSRLGEQDHELRGFFSAPGAPIIVAAATTLPPDTRDHGSAFYDGFKPRVLHRLSVSEIRVIIEELARDSGNDTLLQRLPGEMPRLSALRDLTGGNPRTAHLLYEIFAQGFSDDVFDALEGLIDGITPLYQSYLEQLSEQGQIIVGVLARHQSPMTAAAIGQAGKLKRSSVSPQLGRLEDVGFIEKVSLHGTKKDGYQITERFFNIWYVLRFASRRDRKRLRGLASFLQDLYTPAELAAGAQRLLAREYFNDRQIELAVTMSEAIEDRYMANELRQRAQLDVLDRCHGSHDRIAELIDPEKIEKHVYEFAELKKRLAKCVPKDSSVDASEFVNLITSSPYHLPPAKVGTDRNSIASTGEMDDMVLAKLVEDLRERLEKLEDFLGERDFEFLTRKLKNGMLLSWEDGEAIRQLLREQISARLLAHVTGRRTQCSAISRDEARQLFHRAISMSPDDARVWEVFGASLLFHLSDPKAAEKALLKAVAIGPKEARAWRILGSLLKSQSRPEEAEEALRKATEIDPEFAWVWFELGDLLGAQSRFEEAEEALRKAIEIDPEFAQAWRDLGDLLSAQSRLEEAEDALRKATEIDPENQYTWSALGVLLSNQTRPVEAEDALRKAIGIDPEFAWAWRALGNLLSAQSRFEEAEEALRKAIEIDPKYQGAWVALGELLMSQSRLEESEETLRKAIEIDPENQWAWGALGRLLSDQSRLEEAEEALRKAIEIDPEYKWAWRTLGDLLSDQSRPEEAEEALRKAIEIDPEYKWAWRTLGDLLRSQSRPDEAEEALRKAIEIDPEYKWAWGALGDLLGDQSRPEEAEAAYRRAIEIDPENAWAWSDLGGLLRNQSRYEEAEEALRKAIEIDPTSDELWNSLGNLLLDDIGDSEGAMKAFGHALELDPTCDPARHNLAFVLRDFLGNRSEARVLLQDVKNTSYARDAQALHRALDAAYDDNWGVASECIEEAVAAAEHKLPPNSRYGWFRAMAVLLHLGFGEKLVAFMKQQRWDEQLEPLVEGIRAQALGERSYLRNVAAEVRPAAEQIFDEIGRLRKFLPERP